jgi:hypothetical protein
MNKTRERQFELVEELTQSRLTCWLEDDPRLRPGVELTLKEMGEDRVWRILTRYQSVVLLSDLNRHWKVGGLL